MLFFLWGGGLASAQLGHNCRDWRPVCTNVTQSLCYISEWYWGHYYCAGEVKSPNSNEHFYWTLTHKDHDSVAFIQNEALTDFNHCVDSEMDTWGKKIVDQSWLNSQKSFNPYFLGSAERRHPGHRPPMFPDSVHLRWGRETAPGPHRRHQTIHGPLRQRGRGQLPKGHLPLPQVGLPSRFSISRFKNSIP